jgi:hypothetical protein
MHKNFSKRQKSSDFDPLKFKHKTKGYYSSGRYWRVRYKDDDNSIKWKNFKNEIDAQKFVKELKNKIKTYEKFISKMVK